MDGDDNIIEQIKGNSNDTPEDDVREKVSEWANSIGASWKDTNPNRYEPDVYWSSDPHELQGAIYDTAYGQEYDDDYDSDQGDYDIPYANDDPEERRAQNLRNFDAGDVFDTVLEHVGGEYDKWQNGQMRRIHPDGVYDPDYNDAAEALVSAAYDADILNMTDYLERHPLDMAAFIRNARYYVAQQRQIVTSYDKYTADWQSIPADDPEVIEEAQFRHRQAEKENQEWWQKHSEVGDLQGKYDDIYEEASNQFGPNQQAGLIDYMNTDPTAGFASAVMNALRNKIDSKYTALFKAITNVNRVPLGESLVYQADKRKQMTLLQHKDDMEPNVPMWRKTPQTWTIGVNPQTGERYPSQEADPNYDGEWKYAKKLWYRRVV